MNDSKMMPEKKRSSSSSSNSNSYQLNNSYSHNTALIAYEFRVALKRNRTSVLKLFEKGRQVQPTDHVIRYVAPFTLRTPVDTKDVALLGDILDPNKTGFVTLKRVRELVITHDEDSDGEDNFEEEATSSLVVISAAKQHEQQRQKWIPPKRAPPMSNSSLYAVSTALSLVPHAKDTKDPDMLAIMTAIQWSGKHLSQPSSIERRLIASTPLSKYAVPLTSRRVPTSRDDVNCAVLADSLRRLNSDEDRGWSAAAIVAVHVRSEIVFREMVRRQVAEILVPDDVLQAFLATPRWYRAQVLESSKSTAPHQMFQYLSPVRLPLAVTALRVEMDSSSRKIMNAFLPSDVAGAWARSREKERCAFVTALLELGMWDENFIAALGGAGLEEVLLTKRLLQLSDDRNLKGDVGAIVINPEDEWRVRGEIERLIERIDNVTALAISPIRVLNLDSSSSAEDEEKTSSIDDLYNSTREDDIAIVALKEKITRFWEDLLL
jgi:hypothetical protein